MKRRHRKLVRQIEVLESQLLRQGVFGAWPTTFAYLDTGEFSTRKEVPSPRYSDLAEWWESTNG